MKQLSSIIGICILSVIISGCSLRQMPSETSSEDSLTQARSTLVTYFQLLNEKKYGEATEYIGTGYDMLQEWNWDIKPNDHIALLQRGCGQNGLQCLRIKEILNETQISPTEFSFIVQFANNDGTLYISKPCCGATEEQMPSIKEFTYVVAKKGGKFLVMNWPPYHP